MVFDPRSYLGIHMHYKLVWNAHVEDVCLRLKQRLHLLRRLTTFGVNWEMQLLFNHAAVESLLCYDICLAW